MHLPILRRCGLVLIAVGALDIAFMVWCIARGRGYASSLNIFAVVAGVSLLRGSLRTSRMVALFATFLIAGFSAGVLTLPFRYPLGYWVAVLRHGTGLLTTLPVAVLLLGVFAWVRWQVLRPEVVRAREAAGLPSPRIMLAAAAGAAFPALALAAATLSNGDVEARAIQRADQQLGGGYRLVVLGMKTMSKGMAKSVSATVAAYNDDELRTVQVSWEE